MDKIYLNFFGESLSIPKPKNLQTLRQIISLKFYLNQKDAEEILLTYTKDNKKFIIYQDEEFNEFLKSKINKIDLDIDEKSQIYEENLKKIQDQKLIEQKSIQELRNKNKELEEMKKNKFVLEYEKLKNIKNKIEELKVLKKKIKKRIKKELN